MQATLLKTSGGSYELAESWDSIKNALATTGAFEATKTDGGKALIRSDTFLGMETIETRGVGFTAALERYEKEGR